MVVRLSDFLNTSFSTFSANDTNNTGITYPGAVVHNTTLTPGIGIGAGLQYQVETTNNNTETGMTLETVTTDVTAGSEDFDFVVKLMQNGATASEKFRVLSSGSVNIPSGNLAVNRTGAAYAIDVVGTVNASNILINQTPVVTVTTLNGANAAVGAGANAFAAATVSGANTIAIAAFNKANSTSFTSNLVISVADNTNAALRITQTGTGEALRVEDETSTDSTPFVIDATGNVLVARSTSTVGNSVKLDVNGAVNASAFLVNGVALTSGGGGGASVFSGNVGNNSANSFNVAHNLNKTFVIPAVREISSGYYVYPDMRFTTPNNIVLEFSTAPTTNQYVVIVLG